MRRRVTKRRALKKIWKRCGRSGWSFGVERGDSAYINWHECRVAIGRRNDDPEMAILHEVGHSFQTLTTWERLGGPIHLRTTRHRQLSLEAEAWRYAKKRARRWDRGVVRKHFGTYVRYYRNRKKEETRPIQVEALWGNVVQVETPGPQVLRWSKPNGATTFPTMDLKPFRETLEKHLITAPMPFYKMEDA